MLGANLHGAPQMQKPGPCLWNFSSAPYPQYRFSPSLGRLWEVARSAPPRCTGQCKGVPRVVRDHRRYTWHAWNRPILPSRLSVTKTWPMGRTMSKLSVTKCYCQLPMEQALAHEASLFPMGNLHTRSSRSKPSCFMRKSMHAGRHTALTWNEKTSTNTKGTKNAINTTHEW